MCRRRSCPLLPNAPHRPPGSGTALTRVICKCSDGSPGWPWDGRACEALPEHRSRLLLVAVRSRERQHLLRVKVLQEQPGVLRQPVQVLDRYQRVGLRPCQGVGQTGPAVPAALRAQPPDRIGAVAGREVAQRLREHRGIDLRVLVHHHLRFPQHLAGDRVAAVEQLLRRLRVHRRPGQADLEQPSPGPHRLPTEQPVGAPTSPRTQYRIFRPFLIVVIHAIAAAPPGPGIGAHTRRACLDRRPDRGGERQPPTAAAEGNGSAEFRALELCAKWVVQRSATRNCPPATPTRPGAGGAVRSPECGPVDAGGSGRGSWGWPSSSRPRSG